VRPGRLARQPVRRPLVRRGAPVVIAGLVAVLLGAAVAVTHWPSSGASPASQALVIPGGDHSATSQTADDLREAAAFRADERASRNKLRTSIPAAAPVARATVPRIVGRLWVTTNAIVRSGPSAGAGGTGSLSAGARVGVTGVTRSGWTQVVTGGRPGWVRSAYLSRTKLSPSSSAASAASVATGAPCPISPSVEAHLTSNARSVYRAVCAAFRASVSSFGGYRPGDSGDHGSGRAVDIMVSGDPGWAIARYVQAHARELHVTYVIYQQHIWLAGHPTSEWTLMEDRGSRTANHYDHVHVSVS
jgi:uncharacterized protein YraI